jgi:hypothetical protein
VPELTGITSDPASRGIIDTIARALFGGRLIYLGPVYLTNMVVANLSNGGRRWAVNPWVRACAGALGCCPGLAVGSRCKACGRNLTPSSLVRSAACLPATLCCAQCYNKGACRRLYDATLGLIDEVERELGLTPSRQPEVDGKSAPNGASTNGSSLKHRSGAQHPSKGA